MSCGTQQQCYQYRVAMQNNITNASLYTPIAYPLTGTSMVLNVSVSIIVYKLLALSNDKILSVAMQVALSWRDPNLPVTFVNWSSTLQMHLESSQVWTMRMLLINPATTKIYMTPNDRVFFQMPEGGVSGAIVQENIVDDFSVVCESMSLVKFPFDTQNCSLAMLYSDYTSTQRINYSLADKVVWSATGSDDYWDMDNVKSTYSPEYIRADDTHYGFVVEFSFTRKSYYYVLFLIIPIILLQAIAVLTALLPSDRGEKVVLGATVVVAMYVLLSAVNEQVPQVQVNEVPRLVTALEIGVIMTGAILVEAVVIQTLRIVAYDMPVSLSKSLGGKAACRSFCKFCCYSYRLDDAEVLDVGDAMDAVKWAADLRTVNGIVDIPIKMLSKESKPVPLESFGPEDKTVIRVMVDDSRKNEREREKQIDSFWRRVEYVLNFITVIAYVVLMAYYFGAFIYT